MINIYNFSNNDPLNLSIIMTYKPNTENRRKQLEWTVARYCKMFPTSEIIVAVDSAGTWVDFNKSKSTNEAVWASTGDNLLITDIDVIMGKEDIERAVKMLDDYSMIQMVEKLVNLNRKTSERILKEKPTSKMPYLNEKRQAIVIRKDYDMNGWHLVKKRTFFEVGGFDERFVGWGSEDTAFVCSVATMSDKPFKRLDNTVAHLWHEKDKDRRKKRNSSYSGELARQYLDAMHNKELMQKILDEKRSVL
jgi:predicted glycosyltransferase involved in capsule biosynthesis